MHWEFWPWPVVYLPLIAYWFWLSVRARSPFFFFASNPGIESGGLLSESKNDILNLIPEPYKPLSLFCPYPSSLQEIREGMTRMNIHYPVIAKPDHGERGWFVEKISGTEELENYNRQIRTDFIVQEFIDYPKEAGIFYCRYPDRAEGFVSSVVLKGLLKVIGDGQSTVRELIKKSPRAELQLAVLEKRIPDQMNYVPPVGESLELVPIGNHSRGTTFYNGNHLINEQLNHVMNKIAGSIPGFFYGRFDMRYKSIEDLLLGQHFKILELNGAKSEPAHIYQPGFSLIRAYKDLFNHWHTLFAISVLNHKSGTRYPTFREGWQAWIKFRHYRKSGRAFRPVTNA